MEKRWKTLQDTSQRIQVLKDQARAVLVTGGAGYVGSHTCKLLAKNGYLPVTVDGLQEGAIICARTTILNLPQEVNRLR